MALMSKPTHDSKLTRWWWRTLREWVYELIDPLWGAFRGENSDEIALANLTDINGVSASELGVLDGLTATTAELNKLSGLTADASELNKADRNAGDGQAEASKNVVLDANKDILGKRYDINQSLLDMMARKPYMRFDGSNDYAIIADETKIQDIFDGGGSIVIIINPVSSGVSNAGYFISKRDAGTFAWGFRCAESSGGSMKLFLYYGFDSVAGQWTTTGYVVSLKNSSIVAITYDNSDVGNIPSIYVNGVSVALTEVTSPSGTRISDATVDICIGSKYDGDLAYDGIIGSMLLFNRALAADEVKALSSGAPPDFADIGASQVDKVTNGEDWTGASGTTPPNNWSDTGAGTAAYVIRDNTPVANFGDDKALETNISGGSKTLYQAVAQVGKRYRISFVYRNLDGSSSSYVALGSSANKVTLQNTGISGDGILFEQELLADGTDLKFFVDSGGILQIDHVQVVQIGCVAAYLPDGITHAQWQDAGGNELHGSVSGAMPLNLPSNHVARYIKPGITGDTTLADAVPAGYRIKSMVADVTGAGSGMILNVGTSAGGIDVVNGQDISANGLFDLTVAKNIFSLSAAQSLYVNDDGGTAWSGVGVDLYIEMERVK